MAWIASDPVSGKGRGRQRLRPGSRTLARRGLTQEETAMNLTIKLPNENAQALKAKATARGVSAEQ